MKGKTPADPSKSNRRTPPSQIGSRFLDPLTHLYHPSTHRIHRVNVDGSVTYGPKLLSMTPFAIRRRRCNARIKKLIDCRICTLCHYAFISKAGKNVCSFCMKALCRLYRRSKPRFHGKAWIDYTNEWARKTYGIEMTARTVSPTIPVPDLQTPRVQSALKETLSMMEKSQRDGVWYVDAMPRLLGLQPYKVVEED